MTSAIATPLPSRSRAHTLPRVALVGPSAPPSGGMANQCSLLARHLHDDGVRVQLVRTNSPYRPAWVGHVPMVRAGFRIAPYVAALWRATGASDVVHVLANSGWAWHLFAAPAVRIARLRGVPAVVNYHGGRADDFLTAAPAHVQRLLRDAAAIVVPSAYLREVFARHQLDATIIPNIVDLTQFVFRPLRDHGGAPHVIVTRNLEAIYDIPTAIRAFASIRKAFPNARLTIAGSGPERGACERLVGELSLGARVQFTGRIDHEGIGTLYRDADLLLNPSTVDNMPVSLLEAFASGVPVVSTDVGGIPSMATHAESALLVPPRDPDAVAAAALRVLHDRALAERLVAGGRERASGSSWPAVREQWFPLYAALAAPQRETVRDAA